MKFLFSVTLCVFYSITGFCQIFAEDSTAQVVGYWPIGETQTYAISHEKCKIKEADTLDYEMTKYEVDITIKDSTADSYTIEWFYKNYDIQADNELIQRLSSLATDMSILIKTNEFGTVLEVLNWEEVRDYIQDAVAVIKNEFDNDPNLEQVFASLENIYMSKEGIEANAIKDIQQFYSFHGGAYVLGEENTGQLQLRNNYGGEPFVANLTVSLDEINIEDDNSVLRIYQSVNSEQLTNATYNYLKMLAGDNPDFPSREEFPPLTNKTWTASRIHGSTGWPLFSIETKEVKAEGNTNVEERIIDLK